jgi:hypothetical protein
MPATRPCGELLEELAVQVDRLSVGGGIEGGGVRQSFSSARTLRIARERASVAQLAALYVLQRPSVCSPDRFPELCLHRGTRLASVERALDLLDRPCSVDGPRQLGGEEASAFYSAGI